MPENLYPKLPSVPSMSEESFNIEMVRKYYQDIANLKEKYNEKQRTYKNAYKKLLHPSTGASSFALISGISTIETAFTIVDLPISSSTCIPSTDSFDKILKSHCKFIELMGLEMSEEDKNLPYWTPKLHKVPFKHRFIAGSSKCTTKDSSCLLTKVLTTVKDGLIRYNNTKASRNGLNSMWIAKNSTSLLSSLDQRGVRTATSVQTYDFSTLYTSSHTICLSLE